MSARLRTGAAGKRRARKWRQFATTSIGSAAWRAFRRPGARESHAGAAFKQLHPPSASCPPPPIAPDAGPGSDARHVSQSGASQAARSGLAGSAVALTWLWQSAPPPAASSVSFVPMTKARMPTITSASESGVTRGCGPKMTDIGLRLRAGRVLRLRHRIRSATQDTSRQIPQQRQAGRRTRGRPDALGTMASATGGPGSDAAATRSRVVAVTGGAQGIGFGIAKMFARDGCSVALLDMNKVSPCASGRKPTALRAFVAPWRRAREAVLQLQLRKRGPAAAIAHPLLRGPGLAETLPWLGVARLLRTAGKAGRGQGRA